MRRSACVVLVLIISAFLSAQEQVHPDVQQWLASEHARAAASPLYQGALAAGGKTTSEYATDPAKLLPGLKGLAKRADEIVLVHIIRDTSQLSSTGDTVITFYTGQILKRWKGHFNQDKITFAVPMGVVAFDRSTQAATVILGFQVIQVGGRYVLFLQFSQPKERGLMPALRLVGDGVQGAFEVHNDKIYPNYHFDGFDAIFRKMPIDQFVAAVDATHPNSRP